MLRLHNALLVLLLALSSCKNDKLVSAEVPECIPFAESCNGIDDDCDGTVDNNIQPVPCYPGDPAELSYGECNYGKTFCVNARVICAAWKGPKPELCNGVDDDCDGQIDEGSNADLDLVIAVDYSYSMLEKFEAIKVDLAQWAGSKQGVTDLRISLVGIPAPAYDGDVSLIKDLSDPWTFMLALTNGPIANGGGYETQYDAIVQVSDSLNPLHLTWKPLAQRALVIFTDEPPQSTMSPFTTYAMARRAMTDAGLKVFVFTSDPSWYQWSPKPLFPLPNTGLQAEMEKIYVQGKCQ